MECLETHQPLRGPSGTVWEIFSTALYNISYKYQIKLTNMPTNKEPRESDFHDPIHRFVYEASSNTINWNNWYMLDRYDHFILAFKDEPPLELITEAKLRFG